MQGFACNREAIDAWSRERLGIEMSVMRRSKFAGVFVVVIALGLPTTNVTVASAVVKKTIKCYKGTAVKKITAVTPKCPTGWTTKKPVAKITAKPSATPTKASATPSATPTKATAGTVAFSGTYKGKISVLWSDSDVQASSVVATGTGTTLGLNSLNGTGSSAPQDQCALIAGSGVLSGGGDTLKVKFDSNASGCAAADAVPTTINLTGTATITGGTGKYAGATGTLKVTGSFAVNSSQAGSGETTALTLTLTGNINTK